MAISHHLETQTSWSIRQFVGTARRYRTITTTIAASRQTVTAANLIPDDLSAALAKAFSGGAHQIGKSRAV